ncbi:MAG TPA: DnaB-like helicase N-terminal domain-containing protein [Solirubrobacterales bacterium]|nr:DnaB-like helicase N-terminal domain-containing protein [Solirubrobacterales bacterium]
MTAHVPPQNIEAEESVLGAMLVAEPALGRVIEEAGLSAEDFYLSKHAAIFRAIRDLYIASKPVDELTVAEALTQQGAIDEAGGRNYVAELAAKVPAAGNAKHYAEIVQQNSLLRRLLGAGQEIQARAYESNGRAPTELLGEAHALLDALGREHGEEARIVTADEFAAAAEPGADPLLGAPGEVVIPQGGDIMLYGDGGASKTTLAVDLGLHLAAGDPWLGITAPRPVRVLLIEAEGPRPLFRDKLRRKLASWTGGDVGDRLLVLESPWASFRFPEGGKVAELVGEREVDVVIVGPLTRVGMEELGTLQEVRDFLGEVERFRSRSGRRPAIVIVHHESKSGAVSGAWEGAGDTLLHAQVHAHGRTRLEFQKCRWSPRWHKQQLELDWAEGEGFEVAEEPVRDLLAEVETWLREHPFSTAAEVATRKEVKRPDGTKEAVAGIGANEKAVSDVLNAHPDKFRLRTGTEARDVGRHPSARCWELRGEGPPELSADPGGPTPTGVGAEARSAGPPTLKGADQLSADLPPAAAGPPEDPADPSEETAR